MRSRISIAGVFLFGVLALIMLVSSGAVAGEIINLLSNPDFENGTAGWTLGSIADGAAGQLSIDKKEKSPVGVGNVLYTQIDGVGNDAWEPEIHSSKFDVQLGKD